MSRRSIARCVFVCALGAVLYTALAACSNSGPVLRGTAGASFCASDNVGCASGCDTLVQGSTPEKDCICGCGGGGLQCVSHTCVLIAKGPICAPCLANSRCAAGLTCGEVSNVCLKGCKTSSECPAPSKCSVQGNCVCDPVSPPDGGADADAAPGCSLTVTPDIVGGSDPGGAGAAVTILAKNLDPKHSGNAVHFGATSAPIVEIVDGTGQDATILVRVPKGPTGTVSVKITTCAGDSISAPFPINPTDAPNPTSFTPSTGGSGTLLTLTGTNFTGATQCDVFVLSPIQHFLSTFAPTSDTDGTCLNNAVLAAGTKAYVGVKSASGTGFPAMQFTMQ